MKVRELKEKISKLNPEMDIVFYSEDEKLPDKDYGLIFFDLLAVETTEAERIRLNDGTPYLKFGKSSSSTTIATLEVTSNF